ncbi:glycosyltransferase family 1 protein [Altericroceibacterium xinjiangense]|uniref:glycosyltransferase family 1 protein n=1 Tax=Altericroceibacterium xinjiangense TaxID=762261 RepID=UPI000F7DD21F|nr:glycosyltransferase family 1 protein [Altericroceibacterium xinjiangense]
MIHLIYPHRARDAAPDVIGHTLLTELGRDWPVTTHDFDRTYTIRPEPGDVLIGHAHAVSRTVFRRSLQEPGWSRRILLQPYNTDWQQVGFLDDVVDHCDLFLAITGRYWFEHPSAETRRWMPKMVHLDLAVNRARFPRLRETAAPKGARKFLYIGNDHPGKNLQYLDRIAGEWSGGTIDWAGRGKPLRNVRSLGFVDFSSEAGRRLIAQYDFMITVGRADANPTSVLEAMSWGLTPVCTPTSGYVGEPSIVNVPTDDVRGACKVLDDLQFAEESEAIVARRRLADARLTEHYNWERFVGQVREAIRSDASPAIARRETPRTVSGGTDLGMAAKLLVRNILYRLEARFPQLGVNGPVVTQIRNFFRR